MTADPPITKLLAKAKLRDDAATNAIVRHFWEAARLEGQRNLSAGIRRYQGGSDIANVALRYALKVLAKPQSTFHSRDKFENLVLKIVKRKARSLGRRERTQKRDERRRQTMTKEMAAAIGKSNQPTAPEIAMATELGKRITAILKQEPDIEKRLVAHLGIVQHLSTDAIQKSLASSGGTAPAPRTIQKTIQEAKVKLAISLRDEYGDLLRSDKRKTTAPKKSGRNDSKKPEKKGAPKAGKKLRKRQP
jgi:hypothetical protein